MSVVHLVGRNTNIENDFNDNKSSQSSLLFVNDSKSIDRFSIDFTVGEAWARSYSPTQKKFVRIDNAGITIGRHDSVVIEVTEELRVPNNMYGILVPTGSLFLGLGILIAPAKIEPGFAGKLKLRLFNTTAERHVIKPGDKLGSAIFFSTETTISHTTMTRDRQISEVKLSSGSRLCMWLKRNPQTWISWLVSLLGGSMAAAIVTTYLIGNVKAVEQANQTKTSGTPAITAPSQSSTTTNNTKK